MKVNIQDSWLAERESLCRLVLRFVTKVRHIFPNCSFDIISEKIAFLIGSMNLYEYEENIYYT